MLRIIMPEGTTGNIFVIDEDKGIYRKGYAKLRRDRFKRASHKDLAEIARFLVKKDGVRELNY